MFESFVITLREGIEAALVIGLILVFLRRTGRSHLERWVFRALGASIVASIAAAAVLHRIPMNAEAYEGALMLLASAFVATAVVWMWRHAGRMKAEIEGKLETVTAEDGPRVGWGLFLLTFLLVFREGAETVLLLATVRLTTDDLVAFVGALAGLVLAVVFGVALVKGSLRIDVARFFRVTGIVLLIFAAHLLAGALHEFAEAGVVPIGQRTMRVLGPIVKSQALVIASMMALPLILFLAPGRSARQEEIPHEGPAGRLARARVRRDRRWRAIAGVAGLVVVAALAVSMAYSRFPKTVDPPRMLTADPAGDVRIPLAGLDDGRLHRFGVDLDGVVVRFLILESEGRMKAALDACEVCGAYGYVETSGRLVCLACAADINPGTVGTAGGCNPLPLAMRIEGDVGVVRSQDLLRERVSFALAETEPVATPGR